MLTAQELDRLDDAALTGDAWKLIDSRDLIRLLVAEARGSVFAFRPAGTPGVFVVGDPGAPACHLAQRDGAGGLDELHAVVAAWPAWAELRGSRSAIDKRLRRAVARVELPAPYLAERIADGLDVRDGAARWTPPWQHRRFSIVTT